MIKIRENLLTYNQPLLYFHSMRIFKPVIIVFYACTCFGATLNIDYPGNLKIEVNNEGVFGGKVKSDFGRESITTLNNHGFFCNSSQIKCSLNNAISFGTYLRIWNTELSIYNKYDYQFEPQIIFSHDLLNIKARFIGGYINDYTLGKGLTLKDFTNSTSVR